MTDTSSDSDSDDSEDSCGGVSTGLAAALSTGDLDLGGTISDMSYSCTTVVESDDDYESVVEEEE